MALQAWDKNYREELKIQQEVIESLQQQLMIAGEGGSPGQPYTPPKEDPKNPYVPAPGRQKLAGLLYPTRWPKSDPNAGKEPFDDKGNDLSVPVPNHPDWAGNSLKIAHGEGRGPQPKYHDEYNQPLNLPPWVQMNEAGELIEIPWMKEEYLKEHPELASGPDYIGDKLRYGQLDRILNPLGNFQKPTLDQLRIHKNAYPKV